MCIVNTVTPTLKPQRGDRCIKTHHTPSSGIPGYGILSDLPDPPARPMLGRPVGRDSYLDEIPGEYIVS